MKYNDREIKNSSAQLTSYKTGCSCVAKPAILVNLASAD